MLRTHSLITTNVTKQFEFAGWKIYSSSAFSLSTKKSSNFSSIRFFSKKTTAAWTHITSPRAIDVLLDPKLQKEMTGTFTILNPNYILNSSESLAIHFQALGKKNRAHSNVQRNLRDLVVFNEIRTAQQYVSIVAATELQIENDEHFVSICKSLNAKVLPIIQAKKEMFIEEFKHAEHSIIETIKQCKHKGIMDDAVMEKYFSIYTNIRKNKSFTEEEAAEITIQILINDEKRKIIKEKVYDVVVDVVSAEVAQQRIAPLEQVSAANREQILLLDQYIAKDKLTQIIAGGPATGKSTLTHHFLTQHGIALSEMAFISTDRFRKPLLLNDPSLGTDLILRGLYTQDESRMLTEIALELIERKVLERNISPHVLVEAVSPLIEEINLGLIHNSQVRISITTCDPGKAVTGNFERFQATGEKLPPVCVVLGGQQLVSQDVPKIAAHFVGQEVLMTIHNTDEMRKQSGNDGLIATFVCRDNKMIVRDLPSLIDFVKKSHIDPLASSPEEIYPLSEEISLDALVKECFELFKDKEIIFVDPTINHVDHKNAHQHAYATYNGKDKVFTILNNDVLEKVASKNAEVQKIVTYIKQQVADENVTTERRFMRP